MDKGKSKEYERNYFRRNISSHRFVQNFKNEKKCQKLEVTKQS